MKNPGKTPERQPAGGVIPSAFCVLNDTPSGSVVCQAREIGRTGEKRALAATTTTLVPGKVGIGVGLLTLE